MEQLGAGSRADASRPELVLVLNLVKPHARTPVCCVRSFGRRNACNARRIDRAFDTELSRSAGSKRPGVAGGTPRRVLTRRSVVSAIEVSRGP